MTLLRLITILSCATALLIAAPKTKEENPDKELIKTGEKSSKELMKTLGSNLKKHMQKGGPMDALEFCSANAFKLTKKADSKLGDNISIKRISTKYRNPANAPAEDEAKVLNSLQVLNDLNVTLPKHLVQKIDEHTYKFYKPLIIDNQICLVCHGKISENIDLKRAVDETYPLDMARDYKMGDLRGAIIVTITK
jgi:hypothetical protein